MTAELGVVIVTYNSADVILDCLESLLAAPDVCLRIVVVDNASSDGTVALLRDWAAGRMPFVASADLPFAVPATTKPLDLDQGLVGPGPGSSVVVHETGANLGFAGGVNVGLALLAARAEIDRFWILNPDTAVPPQTPAALARFQPPSGAFSLMGGRMLYMDDPDRIQMDGGTINWRTGITGNLNLFCQHAQTAAPEVDQITFVNGGSMVASRAFYETVGPMEEAYFLYYEEVDWAMRRGALPIAHCPQAIVYHRAGTAIGSPTMSRIASPFSLYFKHRARLMFVRKFRPAALVTAQIYSLAKAAESLVLGGKAAGYAVLAGAFGLAPPAQIAQRLAVSGAEMPVFGNHRFYSGNDQKKVPKI